MSPSPDLIREDIRRRLDAVETLFASEAMSGSYGEDISIRDHMLQGAALATEAGLPDALIAACLLHDIGWGLIEDPRPHEESAAGLLADLFAPGVIEPIRLHVAAKRYLVATDADYETRLSAASRATLIRQGGPFSAEEAASFEKGPHFTASLALRRIDEASKRTDLVPPPFSAYRALLEGLALEHAGV